jgi:hypothetical protein
MLNGLGNRCLRVGPKCLDASFSCVSNGPLHRLLHSNAVSIFGSVSGLSVNQDLCNDVRGYTLRSANQELAPSLRHAASNF